MTDPPHGSGPYMNPARDRSFLGRAERETIARELRVLVAELGSQGEVGAVLGCTQQAISGAVGKRLAVGPDLARRVLEYRGTTIEELAKKHGIRLGESPALRPVLRDHRGWASAERQARALYPDLEERWVDLAGDVALPEGAPTTIDGVFVGSIAHALRRIAAMGPSGKR
jgi:hypothetical protein